MRAIICGIVVVIVAGISGCGGGGGGQTLSLSTLPPEIVGTYHVHGLGLPEDELGVKSNGDVVVNSETPATRSGSQTRIGSCSAQGVILLDGSWTTGGTAYTVSASGTVVGASRLLTLQAMLTVGSLVGGSNATVSGVKLGDFELPPPVPDLRDGGVEDMLRPPPPPAY